MNGIDAVLKPSDLQCSGGHYKKGLRDPLLVTLPHESTLCLPNVTCDQISQAFSCHIYILQAMKTGDGKGLDRRLGFDLMAPSNQIPNTCMEFDVFLLCVGLVLTLLAASSEVMSFASSSRDSSTFSLLLCPPSVMSRPNDRTGCWMEPSLSLDITSWEKGGVWGWEDVWGWEGERGREQQR